jgi:hypothetical protein
VISSPDGKRIVSQDHTGQVLAWDATTGQPAVAPAALPAKSAPRGCSPDGRLLAHIDGDLLLLERGFSRHPELASIGPRFRGFFLLEIV